MAGHAKHKWQFTSRFRRNAFGWRSDVPIKRIKEALSEIKSIARKDSITAAEGAVAFLEKISPALEHVDSSSGAIGTAVNNAIDTLVPIVVAANVDVKTRQRWLERLWQALQDDDMPYIEILGDYWDRLCVTPELASRWADELKPTVEYIWNPNSPGHGYFKGTSVCLASLLAAGRNEELLALIDKAPSRFWHHRQWGVKALVAMGKRAEAIRYAEESRDLNSPGWLIALACEDILLSSGLVEEAYRRYAIWANQNATNLNTFRVIAKKYPTIAPERILRDLVASTPGQEGKWFATAKTIGLLDEAIHLANSSPTEPKTLARAARDFTQTQPAFAFAAGMASLHWIAHGYGYEITTLDVLDAFSATMQAASHAGKDVQQVQVQIQNLMESTPTGQQLLKTALVRRLGN